jgi:hypothetical protein
MYDHPRAEPLPRASPMRGAGICECCLRGHRSSRALDHPQHGMPIPRFWRFWRRTSSR